MTEREVNQEEFLAHIEALFDGTSEIPATYTYQTEVQHVRLGQTVGSEAYETFKRNGNNIDMIRIGAESNAFLADKERELASLRKFFEKDLGFRFFIGMERSMSVFARLE